MNILKRCHGDFVVSFVFFFFSSDSNGGDGVDPEDL